MSQGLSVSEVLALSYDIESLVISQRLCKLFLTGLDHFHSRAHLYVQSKGEGRKYELLFSLCIFMFWECYHASHPGIPML